MTLKLLQDVGGGEEIQLESVEQVGPEPQVPLYQGSLTLKNASYMGFELRFRPGDVKSAKPSRVPRGRPDARSK